MNDERPPLSDALRPVFTVVGGVLIVLGCIGVWASLQAKFDSGAFGIFVVSVCVIGGGLDIFVSGVTGRRSMSSIWWDP